MTKRDPGLDVLRCLAIVLVMFRHFYVTDWLTRGGWIGVDLFFVLSGFLVSSLLFKEYQFTGKINATRFLVRRGFKIYPAFWFVLLLHLLYFNYKGIPFTYKQVAAELFFVQNFFPGIMGISWTLAIEEHFYFFLVIVIALVIRRSGLNDKKRVVFFCLSILIACLLGRVFAIIFIQPFSEWFHFFPTWFRIDALIFGVLISWVFHFKKEWFTGFISAHWQIISIVSAVFVSIPFCVELFNPIFYTIGLSLLYIGFGGLLAIMLVFKLPASKPVQFFSFIGRHSYSIYLVHLVVGPAGANYIRLHFISNGPRVLYVLVDFGANICFGLMISLLVEQTFLRIRDQYFPKIY